MNDVSRPHLRIGIDTGGTFTDIVCVDDASGAMHVTKVASTPANPAIGLVRGVDAILAQSGFAVDDLAGLAHGTTVATNALLQGEITGLGLIVTAGFRHLLEIARQAVPEGYGNSYFWVEAGAYRAAGLRPRGWRTAQFSRPRVAPARRGRHPRRGGVFSRPRHRCDRRLFDARLRQCRARAPHRRDFCGNLSPMPLFRCRATCCRNIANTNAPSPRWSMLSSSRIWAATSIAFATNWARACGKNHSW